jgi:carbamoyltransferase
MTLTAGIGGGLEHGCVALGADGSLLAACDQARVTRVRAAGLNPTGLPDEALDALLERLGRSRADIAHTLWAGGDARDTSRDAIEAHHAYASAAYRSSPFDASLVLVCDATAPKVSVWTGHGATVSRVDCPWVGPGFTDAYDASARAFGFTHPGNEQHLEALARLRPGVRDAHIDTLFQRNGLSLTWHPDLAGEVGKRLSGHTVGDAASAGLASAVQARLEELLIGLLTDVRRVTPADRVCLGGSLFRQSAVNTAVAKSGLFREVFVPVDSGPGCLAVGAALHAHGSVPRPVSPFLGPAYSAQDVKHTLDNCKTRYAWESDGDATAMAVRALKDGKMVGWFDGAMEWGNRALGARSILASPLSRFALENLNVYLKRREAWRGYAISVLESALPQYFDGPPAAPHMEYEYRPLDPEALRYALPHREAAVRVHTVGAAAPPRFQHVLEAFEAETGIPFLINTSFNAFREPIVCTPRDALRAFYGSGLDMLVMNRFVIGK